MSSFTVVYDANVLYPAPLRDLLVRLAMTGLFRARWTARIHDEWMRNVLKNKPEIAPEKLERTRELMDKYCHDCLVENYEGLIESLTLPDPNDRHVLAAAIRCGADAIITANLKDFPLAELSKHGLEAIHPDDFIVNNLDLNVAKVLEAVNKHRKSLKNPPVDVDTFLDTLLGQGLPQTVEILRNYKVAI
jgi:predicted nucleic acid-binding protein